MQIPFIKLPVTRAMLAQAVGMGTGVAFWVSIAGRSDDTLLIWTALALSGACAALFGSFILNLARWWIVINALFPFALYGANALHIPGWVYLIAFIISACVFWNAATGQVPLYLTNRHTWRALEDLLPSGETIRFMDLGGGIGGAIRYLARAHPQSRFDATENAPVPFALSALRQFINPVANAHPAYGDLWQVALGDYDVVYCFLSPAPMPRLLAKARAEMRPGSTFISNTFGLPDAEPDECIELDDARKTRLLIWRM